MKLNIKPEEVSKFLLSTNVTNLTAIFNSLVGNGWHWLLPEDWDNTPENRATILVAIRALRMLRRDRL